MAHEIISQKPRLRVTSASNLIQQVRLIHALAESGYDVVVNDRELPKFKLLLDHFELKIRAPVSEVTEFDITSALSFSHAMPLTSIGEIRRPLIFPHAIARLCRQLWPLRRALPVSFCGLMTGKRHELIMRWVQVNLPDHVSDFPDRKSMTLRLRARMHALLGLPFTSRHRIGDLILWSSNRGRKFPVKAWDEGYYRVLVDSAFTLCPSGDCVWSYRFFEAALCGSIPIIEKASPAYEGFRFFMMGDDYRSLRWCENDALHNYRLCVERLTISPDLLRDEIFRIIGGVS
jgi:hypothetical protein